MYVSSASTHSPPGSTNYVHTVFTRAPRWKLVLEPLRQGVLAVWWLWYGFTAKVVLIVFHKASRTTNQNGQDPAMRYFGIPHSGSSRSWTCTFCPTLPKNIDLGAPAAWNFRCLQWGCNALFCHVGSAQNKFRAKLISLILPACLSFWNHICLFAVSMVLQHKIQSDNCPWKPFVHVITQNFRKLLWNVDTKRISLAV